MPEPLIRKVDAVQVIVPNLEAGLAFYRDKLGHKLRWRNETSAGLAMPDGDTELVLQTALAQPETDLLVQSVDEAVSRFEESGGTVVTPAVDIPVGRAAVVRDPWGNQLVLVDLTKGTFDTEADSTVTGVSRDDG